MDTFIPNMTLANIMHSNSNMLSFFLVHRESHALREEMLANIDFNAFCSSAVGGRSGNNPTLSNRLFALGTVR